MIKPEHFVNSRVKDSREKTGAALSPAPINQRHTQARLREHVCFSCASLLGFFSFVPFLFNRVLVSCGN